ncbi:MAG: hypothetical protein NT062_02250, partial [Proteobacteria bacterium]|nr:hypothetical protein [Pseudomonadota bacterium]
MRRALVVMVVGACGGGATPPVPTGSATSSTAGSPPTAPTLRVDFGDCAATTVAFVSGPMPLPVAPPAAATPAPRDRAWDDREVGPPAEP